MILVYNIEKKPIPAIFEIDPRSFDSLEEVIQEITKDKLFDTLMSIQVVYNEKKQNRHWVFPLVLSDNNINLTGLNETQSDNKRYF